MARLESFDLNLLKSLLVLLEEKNVTRAGERLHLSQSAVSVVLSKLRRELNDPLLVRQGRQLVLTGFAESLRQPLLEFMTATQRLLQAGHGFDPAATSRTFHVMASDYVGLLKFPDYVKALQNFLPNISADFQSLGDGYVEKLQRDEIDILLISDIIRSKELPGYPHTAIFADRFVACSWHGNTDVPPRLSRNDVAEFPYVEYAPHGMRGIADAAMDELGVQREVAARTDNQLLVPHLLQGTSMIAVVPEKLADMAMGYVDVRISELTFELPPIMQSAVWHPHRAEDSSILWLVRNVLMDKEAVRDAHC